MQENETQAQAALTACRNTLEALAQLPDQLTAEDLETMRWSASQVLEHLEHAEGAVKETERLRLRSDRLAQIATASVGLADVVADAYPIARSILEARDRIDSDGEGVDRG